MKAVLLSKNFKDGEGVSEYCKNISEFLVENNHEATIVSFEDGSYYSIDQRVDVHRVPLHFDGNNIFNWAMMLNNEIKGAVKNILEENEIDVIHANDWATIPGGITLARHLEKPLIVTVHSTENERGFSGKHAGMISEVEWKGGKEANQILVTKEDTKNSLIFDLDIPDHKIKVIDPYSPEWEKRVLSTYKELVKQRQEATVKND